MELFSVIQLFSLLHGNMDTNGTNSSGDDGIGEGNLTLGLTLIFVCVTGTMILIGLIGNIVAFCIFGQMVHQNAVTFLLRALAVIDNCVLLCMVPLIIRDISDWIYMLTSVLWLFIGPLFRVFLMANAWTSVIIGMNRYIVVCHPLHAARLCTISYARKQIICVILTSIVYSLPRFFERRVAVGYTMGLKVLSHGDTWYFYIYVLGCDVTFRFLTPLTLLLVFCVCLIRELRASMNK